MGRFFISGPYDIQISGESKNDPSPNTLPNKLPPPSVAPKPAYHRSSVDEFSQQSATQQIRSNTVDGFLAPPSSGFQPPPCQQNVESEDFLPPPPPERKLVAKENINKVLFAVYFMQKIKSISIAAKGKCESRKQSRR